MSRLTDFLRHGLMAGLLAVSFAGHAAGKGGGLAHRYPGDEGIAEDEAVLFHDDFESGTPGGRWDEVKRRPGRGNTIDTYPVHVEKDSSIARGTRSARVQLREDGYEDITLNKLLDPGHDEVYLRYYVRYGTDYGYHGHGGGGFMADAGEGGFKGAGKAPDGDRFFWATFEPIGRRGRWDPPGALIFYAYWWKMKPDGRGDYWGNWFQPEPDYVPELETWVCVEWRVKANTAGEADGELDCWIDGEKRGEFRDIEWRAVDDLKINKVWLSLWLEKGQYERHGGGTTRTVWYDDVVVATHYIGPKSE